VGETTGGGEVDFVVESDGGLEYYQIAWSATDETILRRELAPLRQIRDNYPKFLLTMDVVFGDGDFAGIRKRNVLDWLLEK